MIIEHCPYCMPSTGGQHASDCPMHPNNQMGEIKIYAPSPQGWSCPQCGSVYAPYVTECWRCAQPIVVTSGTTDPPSVAKCETCSNRPPWGTIYITTNLEDTVKPE